MGKPNELSASGRELFRRLVKKGESSRSIEKTMRAAGHQISAATITRRVRAEQGAQRTTNGAMRAPPRAKPAPLDDVPEEVPADASLADVNRWIAKVDRAIDEAEAAEAWPVFAALVSRVQALAETRRKMTPQERPDPNDAPDMVALGAEVSRRLHAMVDLVVGENAA